jgi:hypothetical protein
MMRKLLKKTVLYKSIKAVRKKVIQRNEIKSWERNGKPVPPPHIVKQQTLRNYANKYGLKIFIETGTYYGDMIEALKNDFEQLYSIELSEMLYEKARMRFEDEVKIKIIHGDSGVMLQMVLEKIDKPALFWLDGHYSGGVTERGDEETPIYKELETIYKAHDYGHVIVIDDARCFGVNPGYPTIEDLSGYIKQKKPCSEIVIENDSIRII